jgi:hypothetical protein
MLGVLARMEADKVFYPEQIGLLGSVRETVLSDM